MAFSNAEVAKRFVEGNYTTARGDAVEGSRLSIRVGWEALRGVRIGETKEDWLPTLMSYATPIAAVIGDGIIAVNPNAYSISTTRHQSEIRQALRQHWYRQPKDEPTWRPSRGMGMYRNDSDYRNPHTYEWAFEVYERQEPSITDERRAELEAIAEELRNAPVKLDAHYVMLAKSIDDVLTLKTVDNVWATMDTVRAGIKRAIEWEDGREERERKAAERRRREQVPAAESDLRKVTDENGAATHGGSFQYSLPYRDESGEWVPGEWTPRIENPLICSRGYHVTTNPSLWSGRNPLTIVWFVEVRGYGGRMGDKHVYEQIRLMRPDDEWMERTRRIFPLEN